MPVVWVANAKTFARVSSAHQTCNSRGQIGGICAARESANPRGEVVGSISTFPFRRWGQIRPEVANLFALLEP